MTHEDTRITTVRLSNKTYLWWKANGGNLSHFVRTKIEEEMHISQPLRHHTRFIDTADVCFPHTGDGYCGLCWPAGLPTREEWACYRMAVNHESFNGTWQDYQDAKIFKAKTLQSDLPSFEHPAFELQFPSKKEIDDRKLQVGLLRRFWSWLF